MMDRFPIIRACPEARDGGAITWLAPGARGEDNAAGLGQKPRMRAGAAA